MSDCTLDHISSTMIWGPDRTNFNSTMLRLDAGVEPTDTYGMPYAIVNSAPQATISWLTEEESWRDESDFYLQNGTKTTGDVTTTGPGYLYVPPGVPIEGWGGTPQTYATEGDRHMIVFNQQNCILQEIGNANAVSATSFKIAVSSLFDMKRTLPQRPDGWTSADAAGLPIFPGILRYAEISAGQIEHALRFTIPTVQKASALPALKGGTSQNTLQAYYGARFRLKQNFDISGYSADTQVLLRALKKYGLMLADQGSAAFITSENNAGFATSMMGEINRGSKRIAFNKNNFDMVQAPAPGVKMRYGTNTPRGTCNSKTANDAPFTPSFTPDCPALTPGPLAPSSSPAPTGSSPSPAPSSSPSSSPAPSSPPSPSSSPLPSSPSASPSASSPSSDAQGASNLLAISSLFFASLALLLL